MVEINEEVFDIWTPVHFGGGVVLALFGASRFIAYFLILGVEIVELIFRSLGSEFFTETPRNITSDLIVGVLGFELSRLLFGS